MQPEIECVISHGPIDHRRQRSDHASLNTGVIERLSTSENVPLTHGLVLVDACAAACILHSNVPGSPGTPRF